jgi:hypothetical protein
VGFRREIGRNFPLPFGQRRLTIDSRPSAPQQDIRLDITDLCVFRGQTGTVFAINVCHSIFGEIPTPGHHPQGMYEPVRLGIGKESVTAKPSRVFPYVPAA